jgi:hypothetical protein
LTANDGTGLNYDGYATRIPNRSGSGWLGDDMHFFSGLDCSEVEIFRNVGISVSLDHGSLLDHYRDANLANHRLTS